jgi:hypothetical protein
VQPELDETSKGFADPSGLMENSPDNRRTLLVISIWAETIPGKQLAWRGSIRTIDGQRMNFSTLTSLNRLLCELSGWHDSQMDSIEDLHSK